MSSDFYNGEVILINKPYKWTSFQAVNKIKQAIKNHPSMIVEGKKLKPKVGHAGTLDPLATGLLIVCTGRKTKLTNKMMEMEKEYIGTFILGATTPCFDLEKPVDQTYPTEHITEDMIRAKALEFIGKQNQVPPLYSAVMINGRRAYALAREGKEAEPKSKEVWIKEFEIKNINMPSVDFRIVCSKGTYIRSIARDFGKALNSGAHLTRLKRTRIGDYKLTDAITPSVFADSLNQKTQMLR